MPADQHQPVMDVLRSWLPSMQASLTEIFGGTKRDKEQATKLSQTHPLGSFERKTWFDALGFIPNLAPNAAHAIASRHPSLGNLLSMYLDPTRCARQC